MLTQEEKERIRVWGNLIRDLEEKIKKLRSDFEGFKKEVEEK